MPQSPALPPPLAPQLPLLDQAGYSGGKILVAGRGFRVPSPASLCGKALRTPKLAAGSEARGALLQENAWAWRCRAMQLHIPPGRHVSAPRPGLSSPFSLLAVRQAPLTQGSEYFRARYQDRRLSRLCAPARLEPAI